MTPQEMIKIYLMSLFCLLSLFFYSSSHAEQAPEIKPVAQVIVVAGEAKAVSIDKKERVLKRRTPIYQGDRIITAGNGNIQIRFIDDAVLALQPNSEIVIDKYAYKKDDPKTGKSFATLVKGGFRSITGAIAKQDPDHYKVTTPVAVIGVRGTNFTALMRGNELFVSVWKGRLRISNTRGIMRLGKQRKFRHAMVESTRSRPEGLASAPRFIKPRGCP